MVTRRVILLSLALATVMLAFWVGLESGTKFRQGQLNRELLAAARTGDFRRVTAALAAGADPNVRDPDPNFDGSTPLMYAAKTYDPRILDALLARGVDVNARDNAEWTALMIAVSKGERNAPAARTLIRYGADLSAKTSDGKSALSIAEARGFRRLAALLRRPEGILEADKRRAR